MSKDSIHDGGLLPRCEYFITGAEVREDDLFALPPGALPLRLEHLKDCAVPARFASILPTVTLFARRRPVLRIPPRATKRPGDNVIYSAAGAAAVATRVVLDETTVRKKL